MRENNKIPLEGEHTANVYAYNVRISTKNSVELCNFIRNKNLTKAKTQLQKVLKFKQVIPLKRYKKDQPHRPGKIAAGSFPIKKLKEFEIKEYILSYLGRLSCSHIKMQRTPLGDRITIYTSKPGLIVGKKGANIRILTQTLKTRFKMENPEIEVGEIKNPELDATTIAKNIVSNLMRYG